MGLLDFFKPKLPPQIPTELLRDIQSINRKLEHIIKHMATPEQIEQSEANLRAAIAQEKAEIKSAIDKQAATIEELKSQIQTGNNPALDAVLAKLDEDTAAVQAFVTPDATPA